LKGLGFSRAEFVGLIGPASAAEACLKRVAGERIVVDTPNGQTYRQFMLERQMEEAVAYCPDLFIEPGLTLVRRQVVINGRRPDVLFSDALSRHLLVEIQCGQLNEDHLQRHFYYYFDYRAKYPSTHLRLMFIANRLVSQHKLFLDEHGYEYREYPENEFARKVEKCSVRFHEPIHEVIEPITTPGVLAPSVYELLYEIEMHPMTMSYKMLVLIFMAELTGAEGRVPVRRLAEKFQSFFVQRAVQKKLEENPNRVVAGALSRRGLSEWERVIRDQPVRLLTESFLIDEFSTVRWAPRIWSRWDEDLRREIRMAANDRLIRYFNRHAGGY
jgi:hypothetical protein